jgi:hypothetical protein
MVARRPNFVGPQFPRAHVGEGVAAERRELGPTDGWALAGLSEGKPIGIRKGAASHLGEPGVEAMIGWRRWQRVFARLAAGWKSKGRWPRRGENLKYSEGPSEAQQEMPATAEHTASTPDPQPR